MARIYDFQNYRSSALLDRVADQSTTVGDCFEQIGKSYNALQNGFEGMASALEDSGMAYSAMSHDLEARKHLYKRCNDAMKDGTSEEMSSLINDLRVLSAKRR